MTGYWLLKSEPSTYSFQDLCSDGKTNWNGVRNYQARNFLKEIKKNDLALIYHSGDDKAVVGIAKVVREAYRDLDPTDPKTEWVQIDLEPIEELKKPVPLAKIKTTPALKDIPLIRQSRLSVMPITKKHYSSILGLAK